MRKSTFRRVSARATLGPALAMSLACLYCLAATEARAGAQAPEAAKSSSAEAAGPKPEAEDYYSRRARETVEQDQKLDSLPLHPLAAANPGQTVVVCEAGCSRDRTAEIVYMARENGKEVTTSQMIPTSLGGRAVTQGSPAIDCIGGCYDTPTRYPAYAPPVADARALTIGSWVTTVAREGAAPEPVVTPQ